MQTKALKLRENFYWAGILDDTLRVFDIIMYTEFGTTYNSYVMKAEDKVILFETAKAKFWDQYLENLKEVIDVTKIDYLVVSHTEPDHAGSVERLLELSPQMKILATGCAIGFLKEIVNRDFTAIAVKDNQTMEIGGKTLRFMVVPNLHWPDIMYTFIEEEQILVTCDSFGAHYCLPEVVSGKITAEEDYRKALKYYYDCIIGPFKPFMLKALDRVEPVDITMICTGHGPVLEGKWIRQVMKLYREWSTVKNPNPRKTVIIPYVSAYGYTKGQRRCGREKLRFGGGRPGKGVGGTAVRRRHSPGNAHHCGGGSAAHLGADPGYVCRDPRRKIRGSFRKLRMERRGRSPHYGAAETAAHEGDGQLPRPVQTQRGGPGGSL